MYIIWIKVTNTPTYQYQFWFQDILKISLLSWRFPPSPTKPAEHQQRGKAFQIIHDTFWLTFHYIFHNFLAVSWHFVAKFNYIMTKKCHVIHVLWLTPSPFLWHCRVLVKRTALENSFVDQKVQIQRANETQLFFPSKKSLKYLLQKRFQQRSVLSKIYFFFRVLHIWTNFSYLPSEVEVGLKTNTDSSKINCKWQYN